MTSTTSKSSVIQESQELTSCVPRPNHPPSISRRDLFHGKGEVKIWNMLSPNTLDPFKTVLWCELEPKGKVGRHVQQHYPEVLICLSGEGRVTLGLVEHIFITGVCLTLPLGEVLQIVNHDDAPLSYLIVKAEG